MFYLSKMFTEDLQFGEKYLKLKKCISISILDFNLDNAAEYHRVYRLRDEKGNEFTDLLEVHIIELRKALSGSGRMDDWIRLVNAEKEEDLKMLQAKTDNPGILAAIKEAMDMNLGKRFRIMHEMRVKEIRDKNAREEYVREEGFTRGQAEGRFEGMAEGTARNILQLLSRNGTLPEDLEKKIRDEKNMETLEKWFILAMDAEGVDDFRKKAGV